jgi:transcriptional regulator with XRE-family HTH domain
MTSVQFKEIRERLGLSQSELAEILGLSSKQAVSNIETGLRNPGKLMGAVMEAFVILPERHSKELRRLLYSLLSDSKKVAKRRGR